jgi:hypothetical protein
VSYLQVSTGSYVSICGVDPQGASIKGFPLAGRWDTTQGTATGGSYIADATRFSIACRGAAIAKCAELSYKPWQTKQQCTSWGECSTISVQPLHQACVRMVRADYCGNGDSHTVVGTEIDMFDGLGMKDADPTATWDLEAEWTPSGAQCVKHARWVSVDNVDTERYIQDYCPAKYAFEGSGVDCGTEDSTFFIDNGYMTSNSDRVFLRNKSTVHQ